MKYEEFTNNHSFIAVDIKTSGIKPENSTIIEISAINFTEGKVVDSFHSYIQSTSKISPIVLNSLNIERKKLKIEGRPIKRVLGEFIEFCDNKALLFFNDFDKYEFINYHIFKQNLIPRMLDVYDLLDLMKIYFPCSKKFDVYELANQLDKKSLFASVNSHLDDVKTLGNLFYHLIDWVVEHVSYKLNSQILKLAQAAEVTDIVGLLTKVLKYQQKTALLRTEGTLPKYERSNYLESDGVDRIKDKSYIDHLLKTGGIFSQNISNYEEREGQIMMSKAVDKAFRNKDLLVVEAGTGVGKSFAYLIPALKYSSHSGEKIIISTNTKNLQEQLFFKDLPALSKLLPFKFKALLMKGRENYLCKRRWNEAMFSISSLTKYEAHGLLYLLIWQNQTSSGDVSENNAFEKSKMQASWKQVVSERFYCQGGKCQYSKSCYVMQNKKRIEDSGVIIVNHSLLLSDLINENGALGDYKNVIIDEAHNLPSVATKHLGSSLTYFDIHQLLNHIAYVSENKKKKHGLLPSFIDSIIATMPDDNNYKSLIVEQGKNIIDFIGNNKTQFEEFFKKLNELIEEKGSFGKLRVKNSEEIPFMVKGFKVLSKLWTQLLLKVNNMVDLLKGVSANLVHDYEKVLSEIDGLSKQIGEIKDIFIDLAEPEWSENVLWLESMNSNKAIDFPMVIINYAPIEVKHKLYDYLYSKIQTIVMTSATMAIRGVFKYFISQSGLYLVTKKSGEDLRSNELSDDVFNREPITLIVPSPFEYNVQSKLMVTNFLPNPKDKIFIDLAIQLLFTLITQTKQGSMVLFTSYKDLNATYDKLLEPLYEQGILLLAQGISGNRTAILNEFKRNKKSVLLGTSSFWEGIDVQGDSLSQLIVFKLPFQVPSEPTVEAYIEKLESENKNSFMHYMLPNALLKVRQGFGRLIRSKQDRGVVIFFDKRVIVTRYGNFFQQILPCTTSVIKSDMELIDKTNRFFNSL